MTLQWKHIDFARKKLRKIMIKTNKRHVIPLTEPALRILQQWQEKRAGCRYVFDLVKETLDLDDAEALYKARNNATKCINQSLAVVGEQIGLGRQRRFRRVGGMHGAEERSHPMYRYGLLSERCLRDKGGWLLGVV